jgi:hypothetical protein
MCKHSCCYWRPQTACLMLDACLSVVSIRNKTTCQTLPLFLGMAEEPPHDPPQGIVVLSSDTSSDDDKPMVPPVQRGRVPPHVNGVTALLVGAGLSPPTKKRSTDIPTSFTVLQVASAKEKVVAVMKGLKHLRTVVRSSKVPPKHKFHWFQATCPTCQSTLTAKSEDGLTWSVNAAGYHQCGDVATAVAGEVAPSVAAQEVECCICRDTFSKHATFACTEGCNYCSSCLSGCVHTQVILLSVVQPVQPLFSHCCSAGNY